MKLDRATSCKRMRIPQTTKTFANGPVAIVRVEHVVRPTGQMERQDILTVEDAAWTFQAVPEHPRALTSGEDAVAALGAPDGAVARVGATPGLEIQVCTPAMFTVSLKVAGVEKARVTARSRPGAQRV